MYSWLLIFLPSKIRKLNFLGSSMCFKFTCSVSSDAQTISIFFWATYDLKYGKMASNT